MIRALKSVLLILILGLGVYMMNRDHSLLDGPSSEGEGQASTTPSHPLIPQGASSFLLNSSTHKSKSETALKAQEQALREIYPDEGTEFQRNNETAISSIEQELQPSPTIENLSNRLTQMMKLNTLIIKDKEQMSMVKKIAIRELRRSDSFDLQEYSDKEKEIQLTILTTALQISIGIENMNNEDESSETSLDDHDGLSEKKNLTTFQESCNAITAQKDDQTRNILTAHLQAMIPAASASGYCLGSAPTPSSNNLGNNLAAGRIPASLDTEETQVDPN